ncbi:hypothetical protein AURDEDRAFT_164886 [Auricularia subglabra TFB-10046 SS5]|nr:hypothetical protein AURDEDRAFT_164886 [Auricularia subglabra TFB-10046 SS5]
MSSRKSTSSSQTGNTPHRSTSSSHRTPEQQLASAARSVARSTGPNAAQNIFDQAIEKAKSPRSSGSVSSRSNAQWDDRASDFHGPSSSARPKDSSSRSSARSDHSRSSHSSSSHPPKSSSSSHRSSSSGRSGSTADSASTYTPSRYRDGRSSSSGRVSAWRRDAANAFIEPIPEEDSHSDEERSQRALVPSTQRAPAAATSSTGWQHTYNTQTGVQSLSTSQTRPDGRGNTYIMNVVHNYPPPVVAPPTVVVVPGPVCCVSPNECDYHRRFSR